MGILKHTEHMKTNVFLLFAVTFCLTGCGKNSANNDLLTLDVRKAIDNKKPFDFSEIVNEFEFIALDNSSKESLIGNSISIMRESRDRFYISDGTRNPVKLFDKSGRFLSTRGTIGQGPTELPYISGFSADYQRDIVYLSGGPSIVSYDADGNVVQRFDSENTDRLLRR